MKLIGIVGGIASGKSFVSQLFQELGAQWIDADRLVHQAYQQPEIRERLVERWGAAILDADGQPSRSAIAQRVFAGTPQGQQDLAWLEQLLHPVVAERIRPQLTAWREDPSVTVAVLDAPVLIEAGWHRWCDELVFVQADEQQRWRRIRQRGWSRDQWRQREDCQTSLGEKRRLATRVIDNNGDPEQTRRQVRDLWRQIVASNSTPPPQAQPTPSSPPDSVF